MLGRVRRSVENVGGGALLMPKKFRKMCGRLLVSSMRGVYVDATIADPEKKVM
jgi:hypothetical protein